MVRTSLKIKAIHALKFGVRGYTRCNHCGRPHSVYHKSGLCHVRLRELVLRGEFPGVTKNSWQESDVAGPGLRRNHDEEGVSPQ